MTIPSRGPPALVSRGPLPRREACLHSAASELIGAIRAAVDGRVYVSGELAGELLRAAQPKPEESLDLAQSISPRQRRILQLLADGCSAKEIARQLEIPARTVESHKYRMMESPGLHTSAQLVRWAIREGIVTV